MLDYIEERKAAEKIEQAMLQVFAEGRVRTRDIGGSASTSEFADAIISNMS
jgi:isocitrate/isopropylmalate dehydrogenase